MKAKRMLLFLLVQVVCCQLMQAQAIDQKVNALVAKMTLEEKVGQMTNLTIDAISKQMLKEK